MKPWLTKKIVEYLGEPVPALVSFIVDEVNKHSPPPLILEQLKEVGVVGRRL